MAENRRRFRNKKRDDARQGAVPAAPVTIARREDARSTIVQPKILLKKELECHTGSSGSNNEIPNSIKTIIINRSDARGSSERGGGGSGGSGMGTPAPATSSVCAALASSSYTAIKEKTNGTQSTTGNAPTPIAGQDLQLPPRMTRPSTLLISNGVFNVNARKLFHKSNTDFTVIGVLGAQSVGKSTLLNLLSMERDSDYDYYQHLFSPDADDCIFPLRHRAKTQQQNSKRSRGESLQFFITRERYVLLDAAPLMGKESDSMDIQTMSNMMQFLSVCHVLLLAMDEINLEQLRLLNTALRLRPRAPFKGYVDGYLPQLMFVRTRAQRQHFEPAWRETFDKQLELLFNDTGLHIHRGRGEARAVNSFLLPEVHHNGPTAHHANLFELVRQFRERVLTMVRHPMCHCNDFSELLWFELLAETTRKCNASSQHFEKILVEIWLRHCETRPKWRNESNWRNES